MIQELHISNYALISKIDIDFHPGFNIITGETGAGKSIMLGALSLLLGGRADMKAIRDTDKKSVIEATFDIKGYDAIRSIFEANDIDWDNAQCILRRELSPTGRSRAFINDTPVTLQLLREVAMHLVDIHSQHQNLLLADPAYQLSIIDNLAGNAELLDKYSKAYTDYKAALRRYSSTRDSILRNQADTEFLTFQLEQLQEMKLQPGEQEQLEHERDVLANMTVIKDHLRGALDALNDHSSNTLRGLAVASDNLRRLIDVFDDASSLLDRLESARIEVQDIAETLADYDNDLNADPATLEQIETRLSQIYTLESKHHVETSDDLIALRDKIAAQLQTMENADDTLTDLQNQAKQAKRVAVTIANELTQRRMEQAKQFAQELKERALPLGMKNLRCEIAVTQGKLSPTGADTIDFRFAFNKNQPLMPVSESASGGEISRLILSIKSIVAEKMQLPTVIFDEVDTGVSGDVAVKMASLMDMISHSSQVIAITHLPQVAAKGSTHFKVYKEDDEDSTKTHIKLLSESERQCELALMLSGSETDASALATARTLLSH